ncbi:MAG: hypothetical protein ACLP01_22685 [Solirubrobacteraceae bacterium]
MPFSGRAGDGGRTGTITLCRLEGQELVQIDCWSVSEELVFALEAPVWDRYGRFAGHPQVRGTVTWTLSERRIVLSGQRGGVFLRGDARMSPWLGRRWGGLERVPVCRGPPRAASLAERERPGCRPVSRNIGAVSAKPKICCAV